MQYFGIFFVVHFHREGSVVVEKTRHDILHFSPATGGSLSRIWGLRVGPAVNCRLIQGVNLPSPSCSWNCLQKMDGGVDLFR